MNKKDKIISHLEFIVLLHIIVAIDIFKLGVNSFINSLEDLK